MNSQKMRVGILGVLFALAALWGVVAQAYSDQDSISGGGLTIQCSVYGSKLTCWHESDDDFGFEELQTGMSLSGVLFQPPRTATLPKVVCVAVPVFPFGSEAHCWNYEDEPLYGGIELTYLGIKCDANHDLIIDADTPDTDGDGLANGCDTDDDNDGVLDNSDAFPLDPAEWLDTDGDGTGNNADADDDNDGDQDGVDNCPLTSNADQLNTDGDSQGNACDTDDDNDGVTDTSDKFPLNVAASSDSDNDGFPGGWNAACDITCQVNSGLILDNCLIIPNPTQANFDGDSLGDICDSDDDNDGVADTADAFPLDLTEWLDTDGDGFGNNMDTDDDGDGISDVSDNCPLASNTNQLDSDDDGLGDVCDNIFNPLNFWLYQFNGDSSGDNFGLSVSNAGDVNGDGYSDVIVGARYDDNNGSNSGSARIFSGVDGSILYTFNGDSANDNFGSSVSGAGDVNGDGYADLFVGSPYDDNNGADSGSARIFSGLDGSILYTFNGDNADDRFGSAVSGVGDVNGDGYADVIIGASWPGDDWAPGSARVFSGMNGSILYTFNGDNGDDRFGGAVSGVGDVNGDGYADMIVGATGDDNTGDNAGSAQVFSGVDGSILYVLNGDEGDSFGYSVSGGGDINGDGYADMIVGVIADSNTGNFSGSVQVFSGINGAMLYIFNGDATYDSLGYSVSDAGDVNGDGYADIIAGANADDNNGTSSGSARVFSGIDGTILYIFNGDAAYDYLGGSVSGGGDVNGDGYADMIVGATGTDNNGSNSGSARIFSGALFLELAQDADGDGVPDALDNCPSISNANQLDSDVDGQGDVCDPTPTFPDSDADSIIDTTDNCPLVSNVDQLNTDGDSQGNACDNDDDNDEDPDGADNCPLTSNADQFDSDSDGQGNVCDQTPDGPDTDGDGVADMLDKFPSNIAASSDSDNDGHPGSWSAVCNVACQAGSGLTLDNCPTTSNVAQANFDGDSQGDVCDSDDDNDGRNDNSDNCPLSSNADQLNTDGDAQGNACDSDDDGDSVGDSSDAFPLHAEASTDTDGDGKPDVIDVSKIPHTLVLFQDTFSPSVSGWTGIVAFDQTGWAVSNGALQPQTKSTTTVNVTLTRSITLATPGTLTYRHQYVNDQGDDFFYLDNVKKTGSLFNGEIYTWEQYSIHLSAGTHQLKWVSGCPANSLPILAVACGYLDDVKVTVPDDSTLILDHDDDNDGVPDTVDAAPLDAGNNTEIVLPLNGIYKGGSLKASQLGQ